MKFFFLALLLSSASLSAQEQKYDIATFTLPEGWSKGEENNSAVQYLKKEGTKWAQVAIYKNTTSLGSPEADFDSEWEKLAASVYKITEAPVKTAVETAMGEWKKISGTGKWNAGFASNTYYANYYTGNYAGMNTCTSSQWFDFKSGQKYHWELVAANTFNGQTNVAQAKPMAISPL